MDYNQDAPVTGDNAENSDAAFERDMAAASVAKDEPAAHEPIADGAIPENVPNRSAASVEPSLEDKVDTLLRGMADLHAKVDNVTQGLHATYQLVHGTATMLQAVQQVAAMMPGGRKIAQAMQAQMQNGGQQ